MRAIDAMLRSLVSIQLMSPASGDHCIRNLPFTFDMGGFHSINVPSEWGPAELAGYGVILVSEFPFN